VLGSSGSASATSMNQIRSWDLPRRECAD
jgi:hypothetical protein